MTKAVRWTDDQLREYEGRIGRPLKAKTDKPAEPEKKAKYNNKKVMWNGQQFDSKKELERYQMLLDRQAAGTIANLIRQVTFVLAPPVHIEGNKRATPALRYVADFIYVVRAIDDRPSELIVEDVKGMKTRPYLQKRHLMKSLYNIDILET